MRTTNYYVVLGVAEDADGDVIRSAFRALARRYHPDAGAGSSSVEFQRAREAYETLGDSERRRRYDQQLRASRLPPVIIMEPVAPRPEAEPLFASRPRPFGFQRTRVIPPSSVLLEDLIDELLAALHDHRIRRRPWP